MKLRSRLRSRRVARTGALEARGVGYDGADVGRRGQGWQPAGASANAVISSDLATLRQRSRDLVRNDEIGTSAISILTGNLVGTGIRPKVSTGDRSLDDLVEKLFEAWAPNCDTSGGGDFFACQNLAARSMFESGDVIIRRRRRRIGDRGVDGSELRVPLQLQVLEADYLDHTKTAAVRSGGRIVQGIEFDRLDRPLAYHLHGAHPGDSSFAATSYGSAPVPAESIAFVFERLRPGQVRGIPWLAPVITKVRDLSDYHEAEIMRKQIEASVAAFVSGAESDEDESIGPFAEDADGNLVETLEPGMIAYLRGGKTIDFSQPASVGGYREFVETRLHGIGAGVRVPYVLLTGDLSKLNFSSIRAGLIEFRREIRRIQRLVFFTRFCAPIWRWWVEAAILAEEIPPEKDYSPTWIPRGFEEVDRAKDLQADRLEVELGKVSVAGLIRRAGDDPRQVFEDIAASQALADEFGIVLPGPVGAAVAAPAAAEDKPEDEKAGDEGDEEDDS